jgi:hypothetical protein
MHLVRDPLEEGDEGMPGRSKGVAYAMAEVGDGDREPPVGGDDDVDESLKGDDDSVAEEAEEGTEVAEDEVEEVDGDAKDGEEDQENEGEDGKEAVETLRMGTRRWRA